MPAWPRFLEPKPYSKQNPETDATAAAIARHGELKVCQAQLVRGKRWYYDDLVDALKGKPEKKT